MTISGLDHFNIKASEADMARIKAFYTDLLGLKEGLRPASIPGKGAWLYAGEKPLLHLSVVDDVEVDAALNPNLDHIAFRCRGIGRYMERLKESNIDYLLVRTPELDMIQIFFYDPAGIRIEMNAVGESV